MMANKRIELPQGTLDLLILRTLALEPQHGWAISERIHQISSDVLRHPLSQKDLHFLQRIAHLSELGKHAAAIEALQEALVKHPAAEPYLDNMLGAEYLNTNQLEAAVASFGEAARILPRESGTHSNLGLSLALSGHFELAETELCKALELDKTSANARTILEALRVAERSAHPKTQ